MNKYTVEIDIELTAESPDQAEMLAHLFLNREAVKEALYPCKAFVGGVVER